MKTFFLFSLILICGFQCSIAQTAPLKQWDIRYGGSDWDELSCLQQTSDGGYILGGHSYSGITGDKTQASKGGRDYWIVKTNQDGVKEWDASFGGDGDDILTWIEQTDDEGFILGGYSWSHAGGDKTEDVRGAADYWIVKIDPDGVKEWDATIGGNGDDWLTALQQTSDGGYILGGFSDSEISGEKTQDSQGDFDYWIVKTNDDGIKQWDVRFGGSDIDRLSAVVKTSDGGYILGGWSTSGISGDKTQSSIGYADYWIVKTDANGMKQWDRRFGGNSDNFFRDLRQTTDGGYIIGGDSDSKISGDKTQDSKGDNDYWIVKTNADGDKEWDATFGGSSAEYFHWLQQTSDDGYILGGYSWSEISGDKTQGNQGFADYWIVKTDANGLKQWDACFGGKDYDYFRSLDQTSDGGYILGGYSNSGISGDKTQSSQGQYDYWIVKVAAAGESDCSIPDGANTTDIKPTSVWVNWNAVSNAAGYAVIYKPFEVNDWVNVPAGNSSKKLTGLSPSTEYVWRVKSLCSAGPLVSSDWSSAQTFTTKPLRLEDDSEGEIFVEVFPNPASTTIHLQLPSTPATITVFNLLGEKVREEKVSLPAGQAGGGEITMDVSELPAGLYFVRTEEAMVGKFVKLACR